MPTKVGKRSTKTLADFQKLTIREREKVSFEIKKIFSKADLNGDGSLSKEELKAALRACADWSETQFDKLFEKADVNKDGKIDVEEFIDWVLDTGAPEILEPALQNTTAPEISGSSSITYPNGVVVPFDECKEVMKDYIDQLAHPESHVNGQNLEKLLRLPHKQYCKQMHEYFAEADANGSGALSWNDKEIYNFFILVFEKLGLPKPLGGDYVFHGIYNKFDTDESSTLSEAECLYMMDSVLRVIRRWCPLKSVSRPKKHEE
eukprot:gnl/MRDRNA2_/MRDRNA2_100559_c0_seq1.p1 gnl/MRDRNA2_/MRDRNA2_100559_c0~~gnl/MRDRNA2_/MRDRNA2_100559_c0_seq1.p1  ORF type:complete len:262 (+),score=41.88 gnl/MRDRNA2_/MRDRNA2_100559_c0_seq1:71-856(+)